MSTDKEQPEKASPAPSKKTVLLLLATLGDTSWRLFLPTILGCVLGLWADKTYDTVPWFLIIGTTAGTVLAGILVYLQIKNIDKGNA